MSDAKLSPASGRHVNVQLASDTRRTRPMPSGNLGRSSFASFRTYLVEPLE